MAEEGKKARRKARGATEAGVVDPPRSPTVLVAFRVPRALADRLDRLAAELSTPWHEMKRSELSRAVVERGLDALEREARDGSERRRGE